MESLVHLSGFADEAANQKTIEQQFCAFAALGLRYFTLRFIDVGNGIKNVMHLTQEEVETINAMRADYGLRVSSIGSPIGKVKLLDVDDGTNNRYVPFQEYLENDVRRACSLAHDFDSKLLRGFSFYHPRGESPEPYVSQVVDRLAAIAEVCRSEGLIFGLEVEANLVGQTGKILSMIHQQVNAPNLVLIFDGANLVCQGMSKAEVWDEWKAMKQGLGWLHIKDYRRRENSVGRAHVDEESLKNFVPVELGESGHSEIFDDLVGYLPDLDSRMRRLGADGVFMDLEPHVKGGGQFGGFSGPDGFGVALRSLCRMLDQTGVRYRLRDFDDVVSVTP